MYEWVERFVVLADYSVKQMKLRRSLGKYVLNVVGGYQPVNYTDSKGSKYSYVYETPQEAHRAAVAKAEEELTSGGRAVADYTTQLKTAQARVDELAGMISRQTERMQRAQEFLAGREPPRMMVINAENITKLELSS